MKVVRRRKRRAGCRGMTREQCADFLGVDVEEVRLREREAVRKLLYGVCDVLKVRDIRELEVAFGVDVDESLFGTLDRSGEADDGEAKKKLS